MIPITIKLDFQLAHEDLLIEKIDPEEPMETGYTGYDDRRVSHACEKLESGYEAGFCNGGLYYLSARYSDDPLVRFNGWTYACHRHLREVALEFSLILERRSLDREFAIWEDMQRRVCEICSGEDGEHNWEAHQAELRASS